MRKIIAIGAIVGALALAGKNKVEDYVDDYVTIFSKLKVKFLSLTNLGFANGGITCKINIRITNTSNINLDIVTGNYITLRRVLFYNDVGEFLGESYPNISAIQIPAKSAIELNNIPTEIPITQIEDIFGTALSIFSNPENLHVKIELEALGKTTIIDAA